ncbi:putative high mobility group B protein 11 isoform X1 [Lotus japonicus]|uniref:putative high mobility group B protein 11 isoform X1 n=1 Tax=Lotus japonicus TaxID=34305 RepID=UPI00258EE472|nr:putative high mobility group B protein 11 isoform X1 [Lotus japonicus]
MQSVEKRTVLPSDKTHDSECFYKNLTALLESSGLSLILNDLYLFYLEVTKRGGYHQVDQEKKWGEVVSALKLEGSNAKLSAQVEMLYANLLYEFEQLYFYRCPTKQASTKGPLKRKRNLTQLMDKENVQRVTMCKDYSSQKTAEGGYVEPVLQPAPSNDKGRKKRGGAPTGRRTAYQIFVKQECARLRACSEDSLDRTRFLRMAIDTWKNMSEIEKQPYMEESKKNKEKHKEEENNKQKNAQDMKQVNKPTSQCGDYSVPSQPETDNSIVSAELGLALKMTWEVMTGKAPEESLQEWDTYFSELDLPTGESK